MRASSFDFIGNLDTILAVVFGALLATIGALIAEIIQDRLGRKRRQRDAARFFGEIISSVQQIVELAIDSQKIGDPWGRFTVRMLEVASREAAVYERNRERLFEIFDMDLRFRVNGHLLRASVPLEDVVRYSQDIAEMERERGLKPPVAEPDGKTHLDIRIDEARDARQISMTNLVNQLDEGRLILLELEKIARIEFGSRYSEQASRRFQSDAE